MSECTTTAAIEIDRLEYNFKTKIGKIYVDMFIGSKKVKPIILDFDWE